MVMHCQGFACSSLRLGVSELINVDPHVFSICRILSLITYDVSINFHCCNIIYSRPKPGVSDPPL